MSTCEPCDDTPDLRDTDTWPDPRPINQEDPMTTDYRSEAVKSLATSNHHTDTGDATDQHIALARAGQGTIRALLAIHDEVRGLRADLTAARDPSVLRATESDVDAEPAPVEGSGSERPAEPLSDEANDIIERIRLMVEAVYEGNDLGHPLAIDGLLDRLVALLDAEANERTLRDSWSAACKTANELEREVKRLRDDRLRAEGRAETAERKRREAEAEVERLTADKEGLTRASRDHYRDLWKWTEAEVERLTRTKREAKVQFDETTDGLRAEVELLTDDRDRWKAVSKDHRRVIDSRGEQIVSLTEQVESCRAEVERLTVEVESHKGAVSRLVGERMERVDADGNALVTVRVDDLREVLTHVRHSLKTGVRYDRLRRALDERVQS